MGWGRLRALNCDCQSTAATTRGTHSRRSRVPERALPMIDPMTAPPGTGTITTRANTEWYTEPIAAADNCAVQPVDADRIEIVLARPCTTLMAQPADGYYSLIRPAARAACHRRDATGYRRRTGDRMARGASRRALGDRASRPRGATARGIGHRATHNGATVCAARALWCPRPGSATRWCRRRRPSRRWIHTGGDREHARRSGRQPWAPGFIAKGPVSRCPSAEVTE